MVGTASDVCIQFGKRIRLLRAERGWRQIDLATEAGISENYASDLELGCKEPCLRTLVTLAGAFGLQLEVFLRNIGSR